MKNYVMPGDALPFVATANIASGAPLVLGSTFGIVQDTVANGATGLLVFTGVYDLAKAPSQAWTVGAAVYWDAGNARTTVVSGNHRFIGTAAAAVGSGADELIGRVRLVASSFGTDPQAVTGATLVAAPGASTITLITITLRDQNGVALTAPTHFDLYLSDAATGVGLTGTDASGTVVAAAGGGVVLTAYVAKRALRAQTRADGVFVLQITDSARTGFHPCVQVPGTGRIVVGPQLITANYGA